MQDESRFKVDEKTRAKVVKMYDADLSIRSIGQRFGLSETQVRKIWRDACLPPRNTKRKG